MPWEKPLLRVSRPVAACVRCRTAKIRCDGKLPACTACEKSHKAAECSSASDEFARGKERSYVATLEARVDRLQRKLADARARKHSIAYEDGDELGEDPKPPPLPPTVNSVNARAAHQKEASDIDELVGDFGLLAVSATTRDFHGFTSTMSYARIVLAVSQKEIISPKRFISLPPRNEATITIQHYLDTIFVLLPIFDEISFYASLDAVYAPEARRATAFDHWAVRMVLAIANASLSEQRGDKCHSDAVCHVNAALQYAEHVLQPGSISSIQAIVLLAGYAMLDPHLFDSWSLLGAASRAMVDIGMHQDPPKSLAMTKYQLELRRRVYWCIYALDRSTSIVQVRSFSFSDDSVNVALPFNAGKSKSPLAPKNPPNTHLLLQSFNPALDLFRLRKIQSSWYRDLFQSGRHPWIDPYRYIWQTYHTLTKWFHELSPTHTSSMRTFFELELLYSYVYILSPSPRAPKICAYAQKLIFEHSTVYAANLLALVVATSSASRRPLTFYDMVRAYMTGRQSIDVLAQNPDTILSPAIPPLPPVPSSISSEHNSSTTPYPLAPPIPQSSSSESADEFGLTEDNVSRAIRMLNDFITILSVLGLRFGYLTWRDRFQKECAPILSQLHNLQSTRQQIDSSMDFWPPVTATAPNNSVSSVLTTDYHQPMFSSSHHQLP